MYVATSDTDTLLRLAFDTRVAIQVRSDEGVGGVNSSWLALHMVSDAHAVVRLDRNCVELHDGAVVGMGVVVVAAELVDVLERPVSTVTVDMRALMAACCEFNCVF